MDTGKVRFVYKNFAILGEQSVLASVASECAAEEDKFWEYHDHVFLDQAEARSPLDEPNLIRFADEIGLNVEAFTDCLRSDKYANLVLQDAQAIQSLGVRGTPGFVLNGRYISGAQPFAVFKQAIDSELQAMAIPTENDGPEGQPVGAQEAGPPPPPDSE